MVLAMRHRDTIELYHYWNELRAGKPAPARSAIAPAGLGRLLPSVMLLDRNGGFFGTISYHPF